METDQTTADIDYYAARAEHHLRLSEATWLACREDWEPERRLTRVVRQGAVLHVFVLARRERAAWCARVGR